MTQTDQSINQSMSQLHCYAGRPAGRLNFSFGLSCHIHAIN